MKSVLYISGGTAHWVYFQHQKVVGTFAEPVLLDASKPYEPNCPDGFQVADVQLLVDCSRSEIDSYPHLPSGSAWSYRSNKSALQKKLIKQFPDAIIRSPAKQSHLDAILVQHINLPISVQHWLSHVESSGVTFCSVTCISELLAERWGAGRGCIVISAAYGFVRHTYCLSGQALFTRAVDPADAKGFVDQLNQTFTHLRTSELIDHPVSVHTIGISEELLCDLGSLEMVAELKPLAVENNEIPVWLAEQLRSSKAICETNRCRQVSYLLSNHLHSQSHRVRIQHNVMLGVLVVMSVGLTAWNEWQRINDHEKYNDRKAQLELAIELYKTKSADVSPKAAELSSALFDKLEMESVSGISPAILLTILAEAFSQYRALELRELNWVVEGSSAQSAQINPSVTKVTVSGRLSKSDSLREQQNNFNELIAHLEMQNELSDLVVLQTPLTQFDGNSISRMEESLSRSIFQVQFNLNRLINNEA